MNLKPTPSWQIPEDILKSGEKYFHPLQLQDAIKFIKLSRVSISFSKGTPENYFICSGIVKEDKTHEAKIVYKKRLEDSPEGPIASNCDCYKWTAENHCPHSMALYLNFLIHQMHEGNLELAQSSGDTQPPIPLDSTFAVSALEYGTIINAPHQLERAPANSAYSSLQYLLHNRKIINFPIPENFEGKLIIQITSNEKFEESDGEAQYLPITRFKHLSKDEKMINEVSVFENLYLFDWVDGKAYHFSADLKDFIQKFRINKNILNINDLIKIAENVSKDQIDIMIDGQSLESIPRVPVNCRIQLNKTEKPSQLSFEIVFHDENENLVHPPAFLNAFTFNGGMLDSFRKKKDAYDFIFGLSQDIEDQQYDVYKKYLISCNSKSHWQTLVDYTFQKSTTYLYNGRTKSIAEFDNNFLRIFFSSLVKNFGEMFFRFSTYDYDNYEIRFIASSSNIFQGLSSFYNKLAAYGVQVFYNRNEISRWSSKIRFERKLHSTKWFDLELSLSDADLEIIQKIDLDNGLAITSQGMVLLDQKQKNLLKFVKKYTQYESENKYQDKSEEGENINKFVLPFNRARIFELFELRKLGIDGALTQEEIDLCERLSTLEEMPQYDLPTQLEDVLRPYQKTGYNWLRFLYENKLGACLADDMGLGKTLQTITFIQSIYHEIDRILIICPVTILLNWEKEFKKFSDIDIHIYHGGDRTFPEKTKIILTSYGVMKREIDETFSDKFFDVMIFDEVQHLKNIRSQGAYAARKLNAGFRVCLTGTPVENDLSEFFNILDLSIPGVWGDLQFIRTTSNKKNRLLARKTASPFILRRTKDQVLTDLPPKTENSVYLSFPDKERQEYASSLLQIKKRIDTAPSKKKYGEILRGLLELRQKCLWQNTAKDPLFPRAQVNSTKIEFLVNTLSQIIEEGHQAIIFSQFTTYLDIIQKILEEHHWKLARIDGSQAIKRRQLEVDKFQEGKCPIFLISLKAGGVGLNLTAASYVFVMDPWWNPAVEAQAIDRAHRIGQKNTLTVYRPIIKGSVEEKVLELQEMKKELFQDLLAGGEDEGLFTGKLSMKDFESIFN